MRIILLGIITVLASFVTIGHDSHLISIEAPTFYQCAFTPEVLESRGFSGNTSIRRHYFVNANGMKYTLRNAEYRKCKALPKPEPTPELKQARQTNQQLWWFTCASLLAFFIAVLLDERK